MLDDYIDGQPNIYNFFTNSIKNGRLSHAYLIDANNNSNSLDIMLAIAKMIICKNNYKNNLKCGNCHICKRIDNGNYPDIKIIKPDGISIKKEQIIDLQEKFSKKSVENSKMIYIILDVEKMTDSTSNSLLKFLEEPTDDIVAFLISNNINKIMSTIKSRCQMLKLYKNVEKYNTSIERLGNLLCNSDDNFSNFVMTGFGKQLLNESFKYIEYYENNGLSTIVFNEKLLDFRKKNRDDILMIFDVLIHFYYDILILKIEKSPLVFVDDLDFLLKISEKNKINNILKKIEILIEFRSYVRSNLNINLLFDALIIRLEGVANE